MENTSDFKTLNDFMSEINESNSTNYKLDILKKHSDNEFLKKIFLYTYTPYKQYFVSSANLQKRKDLNSDSGITNIFDLLDILDSRKITGHAAISAVNGFIEKYKEFEYIIYQIFDRNLETRATTTLINRIFPNLIPTFDVALAYDATKVKKLDLLDGTYLVSRKLDGVRNIAIIREPGNIKFYSRNGKEFETLGVLKDEIIRLGLTNVVLDGEICMMKKDGSDDFQGIIKQIQRKDHTIINPKFWIFDILEISEFETCLGTTKLIDRLLRLPIKSKIIEKLLQIPINEAKDLIELKDKAKELGWEGLIARRNVGYEGTRTRNMLKLKEFHDAEYEVKDIIISSQRIIVDGSEVNEDILSAVVIEHKGGRVQVGSGFTLSERREYFKNPEKILGQIITVTYFEETVDQEGKNSLRFPVFKWNHGKIRSI